MVPKAGLEPAHLSILDFESSASANSAIRAYVRLFIEDMTATSIINRILRVSTPLHQRQWKLSRHYLACLG